jgi:hypothetical protein
MRSIFITLDLNIEHLEFIGSRCSEKTSVFPVKSKADLSGNRLNRSYARERKQRMRQTSLVVAAVAAIALLGHASAQAQELKKLSLDDASVIGLKIQTDEQVKTEGKGSLKITTAWPTTVCLGEVTGLDVEEAKLVYKAKVKTELDGDAFLEMWVQVGGGQYFSKGMNDPVKGKSDWKTIQTPFMFQKGQKPDKVTLNIVINGKGTVWVDDIVLSKEALK